MNYHQYQRKTGHTHTHRSPLTTKKHDLIFKWVTNVSWLLLRPHCQLLAHCLSVLFLSHSLFVTVNVWPFGTKKNEICYTVNMTPHAFMCLERVKWVWGDSIMCRFSQCTIYNTQQSCLEFFRAQRISKRPPPKRKYQMLRDDKRARQNSRTKTELEITYHWMTNSIILVCTKRFVYWCCCFLSPFFSLP